MTTTEHASTGPMLLVLCDKRQVHTIVQEFTDWNEKEGVEVTILLYGTTQKAQDGFVLLALNKPLPEGVYTNLVIADDIFDYVQYTPQEPTPTTPV